MSCAGSREQTGISPLPRKRCIAAKHRAPTLRLLPYLALIISCAAPFPALAAVTTRSSDEGSTDIFITGEITGETTLQVKQAIRQSSGRGTVYFDTNGGDLVDGIELGREIRRSGFATDVGRRTGGAAVAPGICHSVCTLSYAGGNYRYLQQGSQLGVHRFYRNNAGTQDLDVGQVMSAAITAYLEEMGVSTDLFDIMVKAGRGQMLILSRDQIQSLRLANFGFQQSSWKIEGTQGQVYLKGEQESFNGLGKLLMTCAPHGNVKVSALYNAGNNNRAIAAEAQQYSLRINDRFLPISGQVAAAKQSGNFVLASFIATPDEMAGIRAASQVGFAFHGRDMNKFHGFLVEKRGQDDLIGSWEQHCRSMGG